MKNPVPILKKLLKKDKDILFAYLYGSYTFDSVHPGSDIDIAVYLKPAGIKDYMKVGYLLDLMRLNKSFRVFGLP